MPSDTSYRTCETLCVDHCLAGIARRRGVFSCMVNSLVAVMGSNNPFARHGVYESTELARSLQSILSSLL